MGCSFPDNCALLYIDSYSHASSTVVWNTIVVYWVKIVVYWVKKKVFCTDLVVFVFPMHCGFQKLSWLSSTSQSIRCHQLVPDTTCICASSAQNVWPGTTLQTFNFNCVWHCKQWWFWSCFRCVFWCIFSPFKRGMEAAGLTPDIRAINSLLSALKHAGYWQQALDTLPCKTNNNNNNNNSKFVRCKFGYNVEWMPLLLSKAPLLLVRVTASTRHSAM